MTNKPIRSGGISRCVKCGARKTRTVPPKHPDGTNKFPRTVRAGCSDGGEHRFATQEVYRGWSSL